MAAPMARPTVAFIHDWLITRGGAERTLEAALELYPEAPIYTLIYRPDQFRHSVISSRDIRTSFLDRWPGAGRYYRSLLPFMPLAVEQLETGGHDVLVSCSHAVAHGILPGPGQLHINYVLIPVRYAWHLYHVYLREAGLVRGPRSAIARLVLHYIRMWDILAAQRVDHFAAISEWSAANVWRVYRRKAEVIYPPVDIDGFEPSERRQDFYITVSRLVPYKRVDIIVRAFSRLGLPLVVVGDGPERRRLERLATANVRMMGTQSQDSLRRLLGEAKAYVYAAVEDFGIAPIEAQAAGCPVIAYQAGAIPETVRDGETGILFSEQSPEALAEAVVEFENSGRRFNPSELRTSAERFSRTRFQREFGEFVERKWQEHSTTSRVE